MTASASYNEGGILVVYGAPGTGKTVDSMLSFFDCAVFVYREGAMVADGTVIGQSVPAKCQVRCWSDLFGVVDMAAQKGYRYVVVDDATLLWTLGEWPILQARFGITDKNSGNVTGTDRAMWTAAQNLLTRGAVEFSNRGVLVILNAHECPPDGNKVVKGGPDFGWAKMVSLFPHVAQTVIRTGVTPPIPALGAPVTTTHRPAWDTIGHCDPWDPQWYMKDRYSSAFPYGPLNTAEMLRSAGRNVPRPKGLEWMEDVASRGSAAIVGGQPSSEVSSEWRKRMEDKQIAAPLIRWALRDAIHRARFVQNKNTRQWDGF